MKYLYLLTVLMMSQTSFAKISDFNALINENMKAQSSLHNQVQEQSEIQNAQINKKKKPQIILVEGSDVSVPTNPALLQFSKEKDLHKADRRAMKKRLANEFKSADQQL